MTDQKSKPVVQLATPEQGVYLEGDEEWLSTLEDPHDTTAEEPSEGQPVQWTT